jgi:Domain of unknown function (DUF4352)
MDQNPNQSQPDPDGRNPSERLGPPAGGPQYPPPYGPPAGGPQYPPPPYGPPPGGPQYPPPYGSSAGGPQYPPYGPPPGGPQYPPPYGPPPGGPPYPPGFPQAQPPKKGSKLWLWILLAIIGVSLIACIISCAVASTAFVPIFNSSIKNAEATETARAIPDNNDDNNDFSSANIQTVPVGKPVIIGDVSCTLTSVASNSGDSTVAPQTGDEFVVVNIKLTNNSQQSLAYSMFNFYVLNSDGKAILNSNVVPKADEQQLAYGNLAPGQSVVGKLVFEVARSDHDQTFDWQPDLNANPQDANIGAWSLGL